MCNLYNSKFFKDNCDNFFSKVTEFKKTIDYSFKQYMDDGLKMEELDSAGWFNHRVL